jgi:NAD(P)-dependent dehydrogenase (short-subunit alcohol dehydrogenase family)
MSLENKIAVVTGGTKGIGRAIAESLLREGASVFICARDKFGLKRALEQLSRLGKVEGEICDVRSESQVRVMLEECVRLFGGVDILVNNAGVGIFGKTVEETAPEDFEWVLQTNLFGVFYTCHHAIPLMKARNGGHIINISSLAGQNAHPRMATYNASKFGLNGLTEALMQEVRPDNIKVSLICPGSVNTEFGNEEITEEKAWQIHPDDIAAVVIELLKQKSNALSSKVEIRPSRPPIK